METQKPLLKDEDGEEVDVHMYRSMIGSLMYLTSSRPDIIFCNVLHARDTKSIQSDYAGASLDRKSTTGGCQFLGCRLISWQCKKQTVVVNSIREAEYVGASSCSRDITPPVTTPYKAKTINGEQQLHALVDGKKIIITESSGRRDLQLADEEGVDCLPNSTIFLTTYIDECLRPKTTAWNEFSSTMASVIICLATNQKFNFSKYIFETMARNLDNLSSKILMYPRKGFSGRVTPLIQTMMVQNQSLMGEGSAIPTDPYHTPNFIQPSPQPQKTQKPRKPKRKDTQVPQPSDPTNNVPDEAVHKELGDSLVRAATTASSLEAKQDSGNITKTRSKETPNESSSQGTTSGGGPRCKETMGDTIAQTRRFLKTTQSNEIASLKRRVKKLEQKKRSRTHGQKRLRKVGATARVESSRDEESLGEDASKQGRINAIDADEYITLVNVQNVDEEMFDVDALDGEEVIVAGQNKNVVEEVVDATQVSTAATTVTITIEEITLAQALEALKTSKPKVKGIVFQETGKSKTTKSTPTISSQQSQDKGKGIMIEKPIKPMKKKVQIMLDEEVALKLQAEFDKEERLAREKVEKEKEANIALIEEWDDIQANIDDDHQLAERLQAQEQEELSDAEKATLFQQLLEKRRKYFAAKRAEEKRNKPPTQAQQRKIMYTYLKNMEGKKLKDLKNKSFDKIVFFIKRFPITPTITWGDEDKDIAELQSLMKVIPDKEEVAINVVPLATKSPTIVDWKIHKEGKNSYFQLIRVDGSSKILVEDMDLLLWGDLKTMFKPHVEDEIWKLQQRKEISPYTTYNYRMLNKKLQVDILVNHGSYPNNLNFTQNSLRIRSVGSIAPGVRKLCKCKKLDNLEINIRV
ncbi:hypothetical protein Tco_0067209 [Tanacetum coccineum]